MTRESGLSEDVWATLDNCKTCSDVVSCLGQVSAFVPIYESLSAAIEDRSRDTEECQDLLIGLIDQQRSPSIECLAVLFCLCRLKFPSQRQTRLALYSLIDRLIDDPFIENDALQQRAFFLRAQLEVAEVKELWDKRLHNGHTCDTASGDDLNTRQMPFSLDEQDRILGAVVWFARAHVRGAVGCLNEVERLLREGWENYSLEVLKYWFAVILWKGMKFFLSYYHPPRREFSNGESIRRRQLASERAREAELADELMKRASKMHVEEGDVIQEYHNPPSEAESELDSSDFDNTRATAISDVEDFNVALEDTPGMDVEVLLMREKSKGEAYHDPVPIAESNTKREQRNTVQTRGSLGIDHENLCRGYVLMKEAKENGVVRAIMDLPLLLRDYCSLWPVGSPEWIDGSVELAYILSTGDGSEQMLAEALELYNLLECSIKDNVEAKERIMKPYFLACVANLKEVKTEHAAKKALEVGHSAIKACIDLPSHEIREVTNAVRGTAIIDEKWYEVETLLRHVADKKDSAGNYSLGKLLFDKGKSAYLPEAVQRLANAMDSGVPGSERDFVLACEEYLKETHLSELHRSSLPTVPSDGPLEVDADQLSYKPNSKIGEYVCKLVDCYIHGSSSVKSPTRAVEIMQIYCTSDRLKEIWMCQHLFDICEKLIQERKDGWVEAAIPYSLLLRRCGKSSLEQEDAYALLENALESAKLESSKARQTISLILREYYSESADADPSGSGTKLACLIADECLETEGTNAVKTHFARDEEILQEALLYATSLFEKAMEHGTLDAAVAQKYVCCLQKLTSLGNGASAFQLGEMYNEGKLVTQNRKEATRYLTIAKESSGSSPHAEEAAQALITANTELIAQGDLSSLEEVVRALLMGDGVKRDVRQAIAVLELAASSKGENKPEESGLALRYLELLCQAYETLIEEEDDKDAKVKLAALIFEGRTGKARDLDKCITLLRKAHETKAEGAALKLLEVLRERVDSNRASSTDVFELGLLLRNSKSSDTMTDQRSLSYQYLEKAAQQDHSKACALVARMLELGEGVKPSASRASIFWEKAAKMGEEEAQMEYAEILCQRMKSLRTSDDDIFWSKNLHQWTIEEIQTFISTLQNQQEFCHTTERQKLLRQLDSHVTRIQKRGWIDNEDAEGSDGDSDLEWKDLSDYDRAVISGNRGDLEEYFHHLRRAVTSGEDEISREMLKSVAKRISGMRFSPRSGGQIEASDQNGSPDSTVSSGSPSFRPLSPRVRPFSPMNNSRGSPAWNPSRSVPYTDASDINLNDADAMLALAVEQEAREGKALPVVYHLLRRSCAKGSAAAMTLLGTKLWARDAEKRNFHDENGCSSEQGDEETANVDVRVDEAMLLGDISDDKSMAVQAVRLWKKAAMMDDGDACYYLGLASESDVELDDELEQSEVHYYLDGARKGSVKAQMELARCLENGLVPDVMKREVDSLLRRLGKQRLGRSGSLNLGFNAINLRSSAASPTPMAQETNSGGKRLPGSVATNDEMAMLPSLRGDITRVRPMSQYLPHQSQVSLRPKSRVGNGTNGVADSPRLSLQPPRAQSPRSARMSSGTEADGLRRRVMTASVNSPRLPVLSPRGLQAADERTSGTKSAGMDNYNIVNNNHEEQIESHRNQSLFLGNDNAAKDEVQISSCELSTAESDIEYSSGDGPEVPKKAQFRHLTRKRATSSPRERFLRPASRF